jgi:hypothetical protein
MRGAVVMLVAWLVVPGIARAADPATAREPMAVTLGAGSTLWIEGTSTMHNFECRSKEVAVTLQRDAGTPNPTSAAELLHLINTGAVRAVAVKVPVATLHSEKSGLDKNMRKAMDDEKYPNVSFRLDQYDIAPGAAGDTVAIKAAGALTICAQERPIQLTARAYPGDGGVWLEGSQKLRMSEYGIKPPTMMMGTIRVGDPVTVGYRLLLLAGSGATSSASSSK